MTDIEQERALSRDDVIRLARKADCGHEAIDRQWIIPDNLERFAALVAEQARAQQPSADGALSWYDGAPPFPQDQEWFIAETTYGDRVVLRSLDEGRAQKGNYKFMTADGSYLKAELVKRWMQFPDCEYLPPNTEARPAAADVLADACEALAHQWSKRADVAHPSDAMLIDMHMRELRETIAAARAKGGA